ncbi:MULTISPECIES: hypothetical protein [unclassified Bacteroides]|jgi:hypothetical protein|uniref:hypothetical protein n=1 Tax=unclassified Bacteroides TaxID=2646097 RepID=UPI000E7D8F42|nr:MULTISPECIES: hypothetical protein [unclassified Bacteroides]RGN43807.1 hypothetical protein DXB63_15220 [Bacteroides sp. OM05-12]RHR73844.1 hypothetical protein DWW69_14375 [Bacteroides sp. AF16-49]
MNELSIIFSVVPVGNMRKSNYQFVADPFEIKATPELSDSGLVFNCDNEIVIELPDKKTLEDFSSGQSVLINCQDSSGRKFKIGTQNIPAIAYIAPNLNSAKLFIKCKMLSSPLTV